MTITEKVVPLHATSMPIRATLLTLRATLLTLRATLLTLRATLLTLRATVGQEAVSGPPWHRVCAAINVKNRKDYENS